MHDITAAKPGSALEMLEALPEKLKPDEQHPGEFSQRILDAVREAAGKWVKANELAGVWRVEEGCPKDFMTRFNESMPYVINHRNVDHKIRRTTKNLRKLKHGHKVVKLRWKE